MSFANVRNYLTTGNYPASFSRADKRKLRSKCENYSVRDGKLFYKVKQKADSKRPRVADEREVIEMEEQREEILRQYHCTVQYFWYSR